MDTAQNSLAESFANSKTRNRSAASILKRVQDEVLSAFQSGSNIILLTGEAGKDKTSLLRTIGSNIATNHRLIFFDGNDLLPQPSTQKNNQPKNESKSNKGIQDFKIIKDFICESTELDEKLTIIVDAADNLPKNIIVDFLDIYKKFVATDHGINIILAGLPKFKIKLGNIEGISAHSFIHCSMDELNELDVGAIAASKEYQNKPINGLLTFKQEAIERLSGYAKNDQQILDVLLEWCSTLANNEQTKTVTKDTVGRAIAYAELFAKDKNATLANSYPPSRDLHNYIGNHKSSNRNQTNTKKINKSAKLPNQDSTNTAKPTNTFSLYDDPPTLSLNEIDLLEQEIMPTQWVPVAKKSFPKNKPPLVLASIIIISIIGLIFLISHRLQSNLPNTEQRTDTLNVEQETKTEPTDTDIPVEKNDEALVSTEVLDAPKDSTQADKTIATTTEPPVITEPTTPNTENQSTELAVKTEPLASDIPAKNDDVALANTENLDALKNLAQTDKIIANDTDKLEAADSTSNAENQSAELAVKTEPLISDIPVEKNEEALASTEGLVAPIDSTQADKTIAKTTEPPVITDPTAPNTENQSAELAVKTEPLASDILIEKPVTHNLDTSANTSLTNTPNNSGINKLLDVAMQQYDAKKLTTPVGDNALETYQSILSKIPNHETAKQGVKNIHDRYIRWANHALQNKQTERAQILYFKALEIDPGDQTTIQILQNLAAVKTPVVTPVPTPQPPPLAEPNGIQTMLDKANQNMLQINNSIKLNQNIYILCTENIEIYDQVLQLQPNNTASISGLRTIKNRYIRWAEIEIGVSNYNLALFLYGKALMIDPRNTFLAKRLEEVRSLKNNVATNN